MRARTTIAVAPGGCLAHLASEPPLTVRQIAAPEDTCSLCLVGSAAGPLADDDWRMTLTLEEGATAKLRATGAMIAQGRSRRTPASLQTQLTLGANSSLQADPGALIVCAGAAVNVVLRADVGEGASLSWHELLVRGRSNEAAGGDVSLRWDVTRSGRPLLRQHIDLSDPILRNWSGMTGGQRVIASTLITDPTLPAHTEVYDAYAVAQHISHGATLVTVLGASAENVIERRDALLRRLSVATGDPNTNADAKIHLGARW